MATNGPSVDIEQNTDAGSSTSVSYNNEYLFFKDIIPDFLNSDRSGGGGFSDLNRLTTLLHSWGFSDVDVSNVTEWKISGKNQYTDQGPRLEWKGNLFVKASGLDLLKCKNKNKTSSQTCTDIQGNNYILLNTHASGYSGATWKWIHISEFGFAIRQDKCYLSQGNTTMNNIVEFMSKKTDSPIIEKNISESNSVFLREISFYTKPIYSCYIPNFLIGNNNINGWSNYLELVNNKNFNYKIWIDYSDDVSDKAHNFNLVDEAAIVIYSSWDEGSNVEWDDTKIKIVNREVFVNNNVCFSEFDIEKDCLIAIKKACTWSNFSFSEPSTPNMVHSAYSSSMSPYPSFVGYMSQRNTFTINLSRTVTNTNKEKVFLINSQNALNDFELKNLSDSVDVFSDYVSKLQVTDTHTISVSDAFSSFSSTATPDKIGLITWASVKGTFYNTPVSLSVTLKEPAWHVDGEKIKKTYNSSNFTPNSYSHISGNSSQSGKNFTARYSLYRSMQFTNNNDLPVSYINFDYVYTPKDYSYNIWEGVLIEQFVYNTSISISGKDSGNRWALICLKNYKKLHLKGKSPIFRLYTSGNNLGCEVHNLYDIDLPCTLKLGGTTLSHTIPANDVYNFIFEYGWSNEESLNSAVASYENPWFGTTVEVPFSEMYRIHDRNFSLYRYLEGSDHIVLVHNNTSQPTTVSMYDKNTSSPVKSLSSTKAQDFIRLKNYQDAPPDYLDILTVKYYHPDKCQWFTVSYKDIPRKTGIISTKTETYQWNQGGVSSGQTYKTDWMATSIPISDWDRFSHTTSNMSGWTPSVSIETRANRLKNQYEWRCIFNWNGGGASYSGGTVTLTCNQLTFNN